MAAQRRPSPRHLLVLVFLLCGLVGLVAALSVAIAMHAWGAERVAIVIERAEPWLLVWRVGLCVTLVAGWPWLVDRLRSWIPNANYGALRSARWRLAMWLLAIELALVQGLPARLLGVVLS